MQIVLFRHGIAIDRRAPDGPPEFERALTARGMRRTRAAARGLAKLCEPPELIISSPLVRARQTAELVAKAFGVAPENVRLSKALRPGAEPSEILREAESLGATSVLCTGHAPQLDLVLAHALGVGGVIITRLRKAGAACFEWERATMGQLTWLLEPKVLRRL